MPKHANVNAIINSHLNFFLIHLFWRPHHSHSVYSILNIEMLVHENPLLCNNMSQHFICHFQNCPLSKSMLCWQRKAWILNLNVTENKEEKWYQFVTMKKFTEHTALIFFLGLKLIHLVFGLSHKRHCRDSESPRNFLDFVHFPLFFDANSLNSRRCKKCWKSAPEVPKMVFKIKVVQRVSRMQCTGF